MKKELKVLVSTWILIEGINLLHTYYFTICKAFRFWGHWSLLIHADIVVHDCLDVFWFKGLSFSVPVPFVNFASRQWKSFAHFDNLTTWPVGILLELSFEDLSLFVCQSLSALFWLLAAIKLSVGEDVRNDIIQINAFFIICEACKLHLFTLVRALIVWLRSEFNFSRVFAAWRAHLIWLSRRHSFRVLPAIARSGNTSAFHQSLAGWCQ